MKVDIEVIKRDQGHAAGLGSVISDSRAGVGEFPSEDRGGISHTLLGLVTGWGWSGKFPARSHLETDR